MVCSSCNKQKAELHPRKSKLITGMNLYLCDGCTRAKMEPRFAIILCARSNGPESVTDYIKNRRYFGEEISAKEIVG